MKGQYTFVDLFCGAGGLSLGFQSAGFSSVCAIDHEESSIQTYQRNFQDHILKAEITEDTTLSPADVIIGGPPCQGFSSAGLRRSDDKRNSLVRVFSEIVAREMPRAFVFENVEGFLTADNGNRVIDLLDPLIRVGYRIHLRKINAANYGVPQHRKRVIAIGALGWNPKFPEPTHKAFGAPGATLTNRHLTLCPTLADALVGLPQPQLNPPGIPQGHYLRKVSDLDAERIPLLKPGQTMRDLPPELWHDSFRRRAYRRVKDGTPTERRGGPPAGIRRLCFDEPSKAITSGAISEFVHPTEDRYLTLRECARIQTFPDYFEFVGTIPQCVLQIGNAVPPKLGEMIALSLRESLFEAERGLTEDKGALLSFVPTASSGVSPALGQVYKEVRNRYLVSESITGEELKLWP